MTDSELPFAGNTGSEVPRLVNTEKGFTIFYKNKFLYSKYNPEKVAVSIAEKAEINAGTLILCYSPCLWYGLKELLKKNKKDCFILGIEADKNLYEIAKKTLNEKLNSISEKKNTSEKHDLKRIPVAILNPDEIKNIVSVIQNGTYFAPDENRCNIPVFKIRCVQAFALSGGTIFNKELYDKITFYIQKTVAAFWKNRLTLVKLGRLFSRNLFRNLIFIAESKSHAKKNIKISDFAEFTKSIEKPILVFGAGESTGIFFSCTHKRILKNCFIISVDTALSVLLQSGINPDAVVALESQLAVEKAYIGCINNNFLLFADMTSRNQIPRFIKGKTVFFTSQYCDAAFFDKMRNDEILPTIFPPLGSVGLSAVFIALKLRKNDSIPVFTVGLDFSFSAGFTHTRGTCAHTERLFRSTKLFPVANYAPAFSESSIPLKTKNGKTIFTEPNLFSYAEQFADIFHESKNLFSLSDFGLDLKIPFCQIQKFEQFCESFLQKNPDEQQKTRNLQHYAETEIEKIKTFIKNETAALNRIKNLLINGNNAFPPPEISLHRELEKLLKDREYLYLHFPDGFSPDATNIGFLKRVRSEIDFFLKDFSRIESIC